MARSNRSSRPSSLEQVAGNGLINRRALLGRGIAFAGAGVAGTMNGAGAEPLKDETWSLEFGSAMAAVQTASPFEKGVARSLSNPNGEFRNSHARTPHHLLGGTVTPNGLHFSINHAGVPNIDPTKHKLVIHGMVRQPMELAYSMARITLGELPEPLMAIRTSPGSAKFFNCSTKTHS